MGTMNNDKVKMKHFRKWAKGKHPFLAATALTIVGLSKECSEISESVQTGKRIEGDIPLPKLKTWLKLYNNPKRIGNKLLNATSHINADKAKEVELWKLFIEEVGQIQKNGKKYKTKLEKIPPDEKQKRFKEYLELVINDFVSEPTKKEGIEFRNNMPTPELIFFTRVLVPCFSLYGIYPIDLLRQAQNGNDSALEKIIRLDKSIIFEPKISEIIHQAQALKEQARMSMIKKAFVNSPKVKVKMRTIKFYFGGYISHLYLTAKQKITAADIWRLYNAVSLDMNGNIDQDFADMTDETFAKDIQDARRLWHILLPEEK
ncbi:MAG: hypothetical protein ABSE54_11460 [Smithella sp.]|jgi:hypothetical protein